MQSSQQIPGVVVITGASAGVGRATARRFARLGASVGLIARGEERLEDACREVGELGGSAIPIPADVADPEALDCAAEQVEQRFGPIDVWINNAMATVFAPVARTTPEEFRRATEVTYLGAVYGTMTALERMLSRRRGTIVQVGSALSYRGIPLQAAYCGAKHALRGFTDSLRAELMHDEAGIHLTMVQLPALNTPQFSWCRAKLPRHPQPVPPIFQPEVAAEAIVWSASHPERREVFVGGSTLKAVWGNKLAPGLVDRLLASSGYEQQQTEERIARDRPDNLFEPVPLRAGARGVFGDRAKRRSWQLWWTTHRNVVLGAATLTGFLAGGATALLAGNGHSMKPTRRRMFLGRVTGLRS